MKNSHLTLMTMNSQSH